MVKQMTIPYVQFFDASLEKLGKPDSV